ncbi:MAG: hypothetical protein HOW73_41025 [Polyangiaceae bacterium]|nr:hypothetical protein [Polyangiaceae bacterium]
MRLRKPMDATLVFDTVPWRTFRVVWPSDAERPTEISMRKPEPGQKLSDRFDYQAGPGVTER